MKQKENKNEVKEEVLPYVIDCHKCGRHKQVRRDILKKRIERFGSLKAVQEQYLCIDCRPKKGKAGIMCVKCNEIKSVRPDVYQQRIKRYGSEEELLAKYLCRNCRKKVKRENNNK